MICSLARRRCKASFLAQLRRNLSDIAKLRAVFKARGVSFVPPLATTRKLLSVFNFSFSDAPASVPDLVAMCDVIMLNVVAGVTPKTGLFNALVQGWESWLPVLRPFLKICLKHVGAVGTARASGGASHPVLDLLVALSDCSRWQSGAEARPCLVVVRRVVSVLLTDCSAIQAVRQHLLRCPTPTYSSPTPPGRVATNAQAVRWLVALCRASASEDVFLGLFAAEILSVPLLMRIVDGPVGAMLREPSTLLSLLCGLNSSSYVGAVGTNQPGTRGLTLLRYTVVIQLTASSCPSSCHRIFHRRRVEL